MNRSQKAQSSIEFALILGFMILAFTVLIAILGDRFIATQQDKDYESLEHMALVIKSELDFAAKTVPGYMRSFYVPDRVSGLAYVLRLDTGNQLGDVDYSVLKLTYTMEENISVLVFTAPNIEGNFELGKYNNITRNETDVCLNGVC